jgi:phosphatidylserine decarboxylase
MGRMPGARERAEWFAATLVSAPVLSRVTGRLSDLRLPPTLLHPLIRAYARAFGVDLEEAAEPIERHRTFNAFFTRRLRQAARPIDLGPQTVVSPCDARLSAIGPVPSDGRLEQVKGRHYSLEALLGSTEDAEPFRRGSQATLYLSPAMYHRVHAPVDGVVSAWRYVPGRLFPVNGAGVRSIPGLFTRNERVCILCDSEAHGRVAVVMVGAANVGRISLSFADLVTNRGAAAARVLAQRPIPVARGDELGTFNLGSTVVLLVADPALAPAGPGAGDLVRVGRPLWRRR